MTVARPRASHEHRVTARVTAPQARAAPSLSRNCAAVYVAITAVSSAGRRIGQRELAEAQQRVGEHEQPRAGSGQPSRRRGREVGVEVVRRGRHRGEHRGVPEAPARPARGCCRAAINAITGAVSAHDPATALGPAAWRGSPWPCWRRKPVRYATWPSPNEPAPARNGLVPSPSSATSPPQPPTCATRVLVRSGESSASGLVSQRRREHRHQQRLGDEPRPVRHPCAIPGEPGVDGRQRRRRRASASWRSWVAARSGNLALSDRRRTGPDSPPRSAAASAGPVVVTVPFTGCSGPPFSDHSALHVTTTRCCDRRCARPA